MAPVVKMAMEAVAEAKARAQAATAAITDPVVVECTPSHNTIGEPLLDSLQPASPPAELLMPVRLEVDGSTLATPVEQTYEDTVLWNAYESEETVDAFAKLTRYELDLPVAFEDAIAAQLKRAAKDAIASREEEEALPPRMAAAEQGADAANGAVDADGAGAAASGTGGGGSSVGGDGGLVVVKLHVAHPSGVELRDRVLWDTSSAEPTPEAFARGLCKDLGIPELEGAVALSVREQLLAVRSGGGDAAEEAMDEGAEAGRASPPPPGPADAVVRTEREALDWSPIVSVPGGPDAEQWFKGEAKEAERRDRLRRRSSGAA